MSPARAARIQAGTAARPSGPAGGLQGRVIVMAAMAIDESSRLAGMALSEDPVAAQDEHDGECGDGDSMNQPLRDRVALAWNAGRRVRG